MAIHKVFGINASTSTAVSQPLEDSLNLGIVDNGNNTFTLRYSYSPNTLYENSVIVGLGSSTMNGAGASSPTTELRTLLSNWVTANTTNSQWYSFSLNGYYTDKFMPYGTSSLVDYHRNISAVLALNPNVIILSLPSNDIEQNTTDEFINNLIALDNECKRQNCYLFVTQTQPRDNYSTEEQQRLVDAAALIKSVFKERCIEIFDELADIATPTFPARIKPSYAAGDSIHVNDAGHAYIYDQTIQALTSFFLYKPYTSYRIERSTTPDFGSYTVMDAGIDINDFEKTYNRVDDASYYYRVIGVHSEGETTSNIVNLQQSIFVGAVEETINCNCTISTELVAAPGWNDLVPSGNIADAGEVFSNLVNSDNSATTVDFTVTGTFSVSNNNGSSLGDLYPDAAARSYWATVIGSSLTTGDQASVKFSSLDDAFTYTAKIFPSRNTSSTTRLLAAYSQGKSGVQSAGAPGGGNVTEVITLAGLKPSGGEIEIFFGGLIFGFGYVNVIVLEKNDNIFKVRVPVDTITINDSPFLVNDINGPNVTKLNFTGTASSGLSSWNDINLAAGTVFSLDNSLGNPVALTFSVNNIAAPTTDNGASYGGQDTFPAPVVRYTRYRTLGFTATLGGCDPAKRYKLMILSGRAGATVSTRFTIGTTVQTLYVGDNNHNFVEFTDITPNASGNIVIGVDNAAGSGICYINAMIVIESTASAGVNLSFPVDTVTVSSPDFDVIVPTQFVFPTDSVTINDGGFTVTVPSDPKMFAVDTVVVNDGTFNINKSFIPDRITVTSPGFTASGSAAVSPYTFTKGHLYNTINDSYIYTPAGYPDNSNNYPLIIFLHGASVPSVDAAITQGPGLRINGGDRPMTVSGETALIAIPHIGDGSAWTPGLVQSMYTYMRTNYRIDPERVYLTGLSLGGNGCTKATQDSNSTPYGPRNLLYSAAFMVCGSVDNAYDYDLIKHMGYWTLHGTLDNTQNGNNTPKFVAGFNAVDYIQPALATWYYNVGHNIYTDHTYNRFNKTNSSGTRVGGPARMDWFEWIMKFSRDELTNATLHVGFAEQGTNWTHQYLDYALALYLVNNLGASSQKTALLNRLATLKTNMDGAGRRFILDLGESTKTSTGNVNNLSTFSTGSTVSNLVEDDGTPSSIGFTVVTAPSLDTDGTNFDSRYNEGYHGFQANTYRDGMVIDTGISTGTLKFTGLDNTKKYEIIIHHISNADTKPANNGPKADLRVQIGSVIKTEYSEHNTMFPIAYTRAKLGINNNVDQSISPTAGEISISVQVNSGSFTRKNTNIQSIILYEVP